MAGKNRSAAKRSHGDAPRGSPTASDPRNRVEWIIAAISTCAVLVIFGFLAFEAATKTGQSPVLTVRPGDLTSVGGDSHLEVLITNSGHRAAADLQIEGVAGVAGANIQGSVTLDYAPAESEVNGIIVFDGEVNPDAVEVQITGFRIL
jgi:uncharacterized protein (TIGR02588 family)